MKGSINKLIYIGIFIFLSIPAFPREDIPEYRSFEEEEVQRLLEDDQFQYESRQVPELNAWKRFVNSIRSFLKKIFGSGPSSQQIEYFIYIVALIIFIWAVIKLLGIEMNRAVTTQKTAQAAINYEVEEENINTIDFKTQITEAIRTGQWRSAVRLQYLFSLKKLSDAKMVKIGSGKTNTEYIREIEASDSNSGKIYILFRELSRIFEYTWYGHFDVTEAILKEVENKTENISKNLFS